MQKSSIVKKVDTNTNSLSLSLFNIWLLNYINNCNCLLRKSNDNSLSHSFIHGSRHSLAFLFSCRPRWRVFWHDCSWYFLPRSIIFVIVSFSSMGRPTRQVTKSSQDLTWLFLKKMTFGASLSMDHERWCAKARGDQVHFMHLFESN